MGEVISKQAPADDIFNDVATTRENAKARGGKWLELCQQRLDPIASVIGMVMQKQKTADEIAKPLIAELAAQDEHADKLIGKCSDEVWNSIGRPAFDPTYDVVFPGGIAYYTSGSDDRQPDRMDLLAELLETGIIPKLPANQRTAIAQSIRTEAEAYRKLLDAASLPIARATLFERVKSALGKSAQMELMHLKRLYKTEGFSETEIHAVIPNRPRTRKSPVTAQSANPATATGSSTTATTPAQPPTK